MSVRAADLNAWIVERTKDAGGLRPDVVVDDLLSTSSRSLIESASGRRVPDRRRELLAPLPGAVLRLVGCMVDPRPWRTIRDWMSWRRGGRWKGHPVHRPL